MTCDHDLHVDVISSVIPGWVLFCDVCGAVETMPHTWHYSCSDLRICYTAPNYTIHTELGFAANA